MLVLKKNSHSLTLARALRFHDFCFYDGFNQYHSCENKNNNNVINGIAANTREEEIFRPLNMRVQTHSIQVPNRLEYPSQYHLIEYIEHIECLINKYLYIIS